ncbi:hypothetical protein P9112_000714 [Eukaryota sp. TZLM1-RC]
MTFLLACRGPFLMFSDGYSCYVFDKSVNSFIRLQHDVPTQKVFQAHTAFVVLSETNDYYLVEPKSLDSSFTITRPLPSLSSLTVSSFVVVDPCVYALGESAVIKIDLTSSDTTEILLPFSPMQMELAGDNISLISTEGELYSLNASNGEVTHESINGIVNFAPGDDFSLFTTSDRKLHVIDMIDRQSIPITDIDDVTHVSISGNNAICATDAHVHVLTLSKSNSITPKILFSCPITDFTDPISNVFATPAGFYVASNGVFFAELPEKPYDFVGDSVKFKQILAFDDSNDPLLCEAGDAEQTTTLEAPKPTENEESLNTTVGNSSSPEGYGSDSTKESELEDNQDVNVAVESSIDYTRLGNPELCNLDQTHDEKRLYYKNKLFPEELSFYALDESCFLQRGHHRLKVPVPFEVEKFFMCSKGPIVRTADFKYYRWNFDGADEIGEAKFDHYEGLDNLDIVMFSPFPLSSDGTVYVPKRDEDGDVEENAFVPSEVLVNIRHISTCDELAAFVTFDGYVWIWKLEENELFKHQSLRHVTQISVSHFLGLVVLNDGTLLGWSSHGDCGFLPNGVEKIPMETPVIIDLPPMEYVEVAYDHAICLTKEGTVYTFGSNKSGKCGVDSDDNVIPPTLLPFEAVDHVAIGEDNSYIIKDDVIYACGQRDGLLRKSKQSFCASFKPGFALSTGPEKKGSELLKKPWDKEANAKLIKEASHGLNRIAFGIVGNLFFVNKEGKLLAKSNHRYEVLGTCKKSKYGFTQVINGNDVSDVFVADESLLFKTQSGQVFACGDGEKLAIPSTRNDIGGFIRTVKVAIPYKEVTGAKYFCGEDGRIAVLFPDGKGGIIQGRRGLLYPKVIYDSPNAMITSNRDSEWFLKEDGSVYRASPKLRRIVGLSNVVLLSVSGSHGLALLNDGNVVAWGRCSFNDDSDADSIDLNFNDLSSPSCCTSEDGNGFGSNYSFLRVPNLPKVKAIAAGNHYSLFVTEEGKVLVIGDNDKGQIGLGGVEKAEVLTEIPNLDNVSGVKALDHSAVVVSNGELYISGKLGKFFFDEPCTTFTKIPEVKYTPALNYSKLGYVEPNDIDFSQDETRINYLNRIRTSTKLADIIIANDNEFVFNHKNQFDIPYHGKMVLKLPKIQQLFSSEHRPVVCTQDVTYHVPLIDYENPEEAYGYIKGLDSLKMKQFVYSANSFFGLDAMGNVYQINENFEAKEITKLKNVRQMSLFDSSLAFVTFDGSLWIWDKDSYGFTKNQLICHPCLLNVKQVAIGNLGNCRHFHLVVLNDGTLLCWGNGKHVGFCNDEIPMEIPEIIDVPPMEYVAVSGDHAICLTKEGTVYTFGSNKHGKCGVISDDNVIAPTLLPFEAVDHVAISKDNSYFIKDDVVYACGKSSGIFSRPPPYHQFKPTISLSTGVKSRMLSEPLTDWSLEESSLIFKNAMQNLDRIAHYDDRLVYVNDEGIALGIGCNYSYQLGFGHSTSVTKFTQIPLFNGVRSVYLTKHFSLFQSLEGEVFGCGLYLDAFKTLTPGLSIEHTEKTVSSLGSLGFINGVCNHYQDSVLVLNGIAMLAKEGSKPVTLLSDVVQIFSSDISSVWLLTSSGHVYRYSRSLKRIIGLSRVALLSVSKTHGLALLNDGRVVSWGKVNTNALGFSPDDVPDDVYLDDGEGSVPEFSYVDDEYGFPIDATFHYKIIPNLPKVKAIAAGNHYSLFVTEEGKVLVIGDNDKGQIGLGGVEKAEVLTEIPNLENASGVRAFEDSAVVVSNGELYISGKLGKFFFGEPCTTFTKIPEVKYTPALNYSKLGYVEPNDIDFSQDETRINYLNRIRPIDSFSFHFFDSQSNYCDCSSGNIVKFPLGDDVIESYIVKDFPIVRNSKGQYFTINNRDEFDRYHISGLDNVKVKYFCYLPSWFDLPAALRALTTDGDVFTIPLSKTDHYIPAGEAQLLSEISNVRQMTITTLYSLFVTFDGHLYYWGRTGLDACLIRHPTLHNVKQVAIGTRSHLKGPLLVVLNDGTLLGAAEKFYPGFKPEYDTPEIPMETPIIIDVPPMEYVEVSGDHAICLTKEGTVYTFGSNNYGKCGVNSDSKIIPPTLLPFEGVDHVAIDDQCTFLIKDDQLYRCGYRNDSHGEDSDGFVPVVSLKYGCLAKDLDQVIDDLETNQNIEAEVAQEESTEQVETQPSVDEAEIKEAEVAQEESTEQVETQPSVDEAEIKEAEVAQEESTEQVETQPSVVEAEIKEAEVAQEESTEQVETQPSVDEAEIKEAEVAQEESTEQVETQPSVVEAEIKEAEVAQEESTEQVETQPSVDEAEIKEAEVAQEESTEQVETQPSVDEAEIKEAEVAQEESTEQVETQPSVDEAEIKEAEVAQEESTEQVETQPSVDEAEIKEAEVAQEESTEQVETQPSVDEAEIKEAEVAQEESTEQVETQPSVVEAEIKEAEVAQEESTEQVETQPSVVEAEIKEAEVAQEESTEQVETQPSVDEAEIKEAEVAQEESTEQVETQPSVVEAEIKEAEVAQEESTEQVETQPSVDEAEIKEAEVAQEESTEQVETQPSVDEAEIKEAEVAQEESTEQVETQPSVDEAEIKEAEVAQEESTEQVETQPSVDEAEIKEAEVAQEESTEQVETQPSVDEAEIKEAEVAQEESTEQVETQPSVDEAEIKEAEVAQEESTEQVETQPSVDEPEIKEAEVAQEESTEQVETQPSVDEAEIKEAEVAQEESTEQVETQPSVAEAEIKEAEVAQEESTEQVETQPSVAEAEIKEAEVAQEESTEQVETQPSVAEAEIKEAEVAQEESTEQVETQPSVDDAEIKEAEVAQEESTEQVETQPSVDEPEIKEAEVAQEESTEQVETQPSVAEPEIKEAEVAQEESTEQVEVQPSVDDVEIKEAEVAQEESTEQVEAQPSVDDVEIKEAEVAQEESTEQVEAQPSVDDVEIKEAEVAQEESTVQVETQPAVDDAEITEAEVAQEESTVQVETQPAVDDVEIKEAQVAQEESTEQDETQPSVDDPSSSLSLAIDVIRESGDCPNPLLTPRNSAIKNELDEQSPKPTNVKHFGHLKKRGKIFKTWRQRWFVLRNSTLSYFKDINDDKPKKVITLSHDSSVNHISVDLYNSLKLTRPHNHYFVFSASPDTRLFVLEAESETDRNIWIKKIRQAIPPDFSSFI